MRKPARKREKKT